MELCDKVALITGAGRGIGKAIALALAQKRCNVVVAARTEEQIRSVEDEIRQQGVGAAGVAVDLSRSSEVRRLCETVINRFGTIDILINNAAVLTSAPFADVGEKEWDEAFAVNVRAPFLLSQWALRVMAAKRAGYIINISSTAALEVPPTLTAYGASKKALIGLTESLYESAKDQGVKVSYICPGMTDTEMLRAFNPPVEPSLWMLPEDIVGCVLFLLEQSERIAVKEIVPWAARYDKI